MQDIDLEYYMFDWDDNILFMPTSIYLEHNGEPVEVTTKRFAEVRKDESYGPIDGDWDKAFTLFSDPPLGRGDFVGDTLTAISEGNFAPSYPAFKKALRDAALFAIVTARGHSGATIRKGIECFIEKALSEDEHKEMLENVHNFNRLAGIDIPDDSALARYLDLNSYVGVSHPGFLRMFGDDVPDEASNEVDEAAKNPEKAKTYAVRHFVENTLKLIKNLKAANIRSISFGFSDDDKGNYVAMRKFMMQELVKEFKNARFFIYDTSGGKIRVEGLQHRD
jgi:hypothetical protein